jgi:gliding motility-associated-like protein
VTLTLFDSICHASFNYSFTTSIIRDDQRLWVPNTFTPNEDGINEFLTIAGNDCFNDDRFVILNRLGYVVFETDQPFQEFWDGKINGKPSQQDSYVWYFETEDGRVHGTINVIH